MHVSGASRVSGIALASQPSTPSPCCSALATSGWRPTIHLVRTIRSFSSTKGKITISAIMMYFKKLGYLGAFRFLQRKDTKFLPEPSTLTGMLITADLIYAGRVTLPTVEEIGRMVYILKKGAVWSHLELIISSMPYGYSLACAINSPLAGIWYSPHGGPFWVEDISKLCLCTSHTSENVANTDCCSAAS